jgi:hypothetical protein
MNGWLASLLVTSLTRPRDGFKQVLKIQLLGSELAAALLAVAILATLVNGAFARMPGAPQDFMQALILTQPILVAVLQAVSIPIVAGMSMLLARLFGGKGSFRDSLYLVIWIDVVMLCIQVVLLILGLLISPALAAGGAMLAMLWSLYALAAGIQTIHGFRYLALVLLVILGLGLALVLLMAMAGVTPAGIA